MSTVTSTKTGATKETDPPAAAHVGSPPPSKEDIRRIGMMPGTPRADLWWKLRTATFSRDRVEHIIVTLLYWQKDPSMNYPRYRAYKRGLEAKQSRYNRAYWHNLRKFINKFGNIKKTGKTSLYQPGRFFLVKRQEDGNFPPHDTFLGHNQTGRSTNNKTPNDDASDVEGASKEATEAESILKAESDATGVAAYFNWQLRIHMPWRDEITQEVHERDFIVVPKEDANILVAKIYTDPLLAAFHGRDRVYKLISRRYIGVSRAAVADSIKRHEASQIRQSATSPFIRQPGREARYPNHIWQLDYTGDVVSKTTRTLQSITLVVVDCFSRYAWGITVNRKGFRKHTAVKEFLYDLFLREGAPAILQGDQAFKSLREICDEFGTRLIIDQPYHWQAHAVVERFNRSIKDKQRLVGANTQTAPDRTVTKIQRVIRMVLASMNSLPSQVLGGLSPFQVYRGRAPTNPSTRLDRHLEDTIDPTDDTPTDTPAGSASGEDDEEKKEETKDSVEEQETKVAPTTTKTTSSTKEPADENGENVATQRRWMGSSRDPYVFKVGDMLPGYWVVNRDPDDEEEDGDNDEKEDETEKYWALIKIVGRGRSGVMKDGQKARHYDIRFCERGDYPYSFPCPGNNQEITENDLMENAIGAMKLRWEGQSPVRFTTGLEKATTGLLTAIKRARYGVQSQRGRKASPPILADKNSTLQTMYDYYSTWESRLEEAITDTEEVQHGLGRPTRTAWEAQRAELVTPDTYGHIPAEVPVLLSPRGGMDADTALDEAHPAVRHFRGSRKAATSMHSRLRKKSKTKRRKLFARSQSHLDRTQGQVQVFDVVRLMQRARNSPDDEYARRPGRTVGNVYRAREKGAPLSWKADADNTDPFRLRDEWSLELFLVTRVVYLRQELRSTGATKIPDDWQTSAVVDTRMLGATNKERNERMKELTASGIIPRYTVRRIDLKPSAGVYVDLVRLRDAARTMVASGATDSVDTDYPHFSLADADHQVMYFRRDLLRIPQDNVHRFQTSVNNPPNTQRTLTAPRIRPPTRRVS